LINNWSEWLSSIDWFKQISQIFFNVLALFYCLRDWILWFWWKKVFLLNPVISYLFAVSEKNDQCAPPLFLFLPLLKIIFLFHNLPILPNSIKSFIRFFSFFLFVIVRFFYLSCWSILILISINSLVLKYLIGMTGQIMGNGRVYWQQKKTI
jgi:hypothetical protein